MLKKKVMFLLSLSLIYTVSCATKVAKFTEQGNKYMVQGHFPDAYKSFRNAMYYEDDMDNCEVLYGLTYSLTRTLEDKLNKINREYNSIISGDIEIDEKVEKVKKLDKYIDEFEELRYVSLNREAFNEYIKEHKIDVKDLCRRKSSKRVKCDFEALIYILQDLEKRKECKWQDYAKDMFEDFKLKLPETFNVAKVLNLKYEILKRKEDISKAKDNVLRNYVAHVKSKVEEQYKACSYSNSLRFMDRSINKISKYTRYASILRDYKENKTEELKDILRNVYNSCKDDNCRASIYLYSEHLLNFTDDFSDIHTAQYKRVCFRVNVDSDNRYFNEELLKTFRNSSVVGSDCMNTLDIQARSRFDYRKDINVIHDYTYYSTLEPKRYEAGRKFKEFYLSVVQNYCSGCYDYERCALGLRREVHNYLGGLLGALGTLSDAFAYGQMNAIYTSKLWECARYTGSAYNACVRRVEQERKEFFRRLLRDDCRTLKDMYYTEGVYNVERTIRRLDYTKKIYTYIFSMEVEGDYNFNYAYANENKSNSFVKSENVERVTEEIIINSGDYSQACKYARYFSTFNGKDTVCVKPKSPETISREEAYIEVSKKVARKTAKDILNELNIPSILLRLSETDRPNRYIHLLGYKIYVGKINDPEEVIDFTENMICSYISQIGRKDETD